MMIAEEYILEENIWKKNILKVGSIENNSKIDCEMNHLLTTAVASWMIAKLTLQDLVVNTEMNVKKALG